jgi:hypothetical protein
MFGMILSNVVQVWPILWFFIRSLPRGLIVGLLIPDGRLDMKICLSFLVWRVQMLGAHHFPLHNFGSVMPIQTQAILLRNTVYGLFQYATQRLWGWIYLFMTLWCVSLLNFCLVPVFLFFLFFCWFYTLNWIICCSSNAFCAYYPPACILIILAKPVR